MFPKFWDVRRIIPISVPLCLRPERSDVPISPAISSASGLGELWSKALSRAVGDADDIEPSEDGPEWLNLKTWTVSVEEETQSSVEVVLNDMLYILEGIEPRRNWYSLCPSGTEKTRIIVPLSEAVARSVPSPLSAMHASGERCASMTLIASSFKVSKIKTSPLVGETWVVPGGACAGGLNGVGGAFCGRGYAR